MSKTVSIVVASVVAALIGLAIGRSGYNFGSCNCCPSCHSFGIYKPHECKPDAKPVPMPPIRPGLPPNV